MKLKDLSIHAFAIIEGLSEEERNDWLNDEGIDGYEIASYIDDHWFAITGLTNRDKDEEGHFPNEVNSICSELGYEDDLGDDWSSVREGSNDWEPWYCVECENMLDWDHYDKDEPCQNCQNFLKGNLND